MTVTIAQQASANTAVDPTSVALAGAPTAGNTLLAIMSSDTTIQTTPTAGATNTYTQRIGQVNAQGFYVWTRLVVSGDSATTTFDITGANPACLMVFEIVGTYDKIGTGATTVGSAGASRTTTGLSPATADNLVIAIAGLHSLVVVTSGGAVNNGFTILRTQFASTAVNTQSSIITASKATGSTAATGTTTITWTGSANDYDGVQIAFTGSGGGAPAIPPLLIMQTRRAY